MSNILNHDTSNTTKPASAINPPDSPKRTTFDDVVNVLEDYFTSQSRDQNKFYKDGKVHIVRDEFDIISFINNVHQMAESCIKTECQLTDDQASQVSEVFKALSSLTKLLKNTFNPKDVEYLFVVRLLSYCTYSYIKYHNSYARSRKIQEENGNAEG